MRKGINPRSRWEIIYDILQETSEEEKRGEGKAKKTPIMQRAYLDWRNFQRHFEFLMEQGFIDCVEGENCYYLTEKGNDLRNQLRDLKNMVQQPTTKSGKSFRGQF